MSVNVSKCSGWDRRVNELRDNDQGSVVREAYLVWKLRVSSFRLQIDSATGNSQLATGNCE